jgi:hypothetical protein
MLTIQIKDLLHQLRLGKLNVASATLLEPYSASGLILDLGGRYPILFQERRFGKKHEVGMARSLRFEFAVRKSGESLFPQVSLLPILWRCLFVSSYEDSISELTMATGIRVWPHAEASKDLVLKMGRGYKLDRTPDGWVLKPIKRREVTLSESFLLGRGWKIDALLPFSPRV